MTGPDGTDGPDGRTGSTGWTTILDELEADVEAVATAVAEDRPVPDRPWIPPEDPGPVPAELRPRAEALARRLHAVHALAAQQRRVLVDEQSAVDRRRDAGTAYAASAGPTFGDPTA